MLVSRTERFYMERFGKGTSKGVRKLRKVTWWILFFPIFVHVSVIDQNSFPTV
jgi:hypothetical protein